MKTAKDRKIDPKCSNDNKDKHRRKKHKEIVFALFYHYLVILNRTVETTGARRTR